MITDEAGNDVVFDTQQITSIGISSIVLFLSSNSYLQPRNTMQGGVPDRGAGVRRGAGYEGRCRVGVPHSKGSVQAHQSNSSVESLASGRWTSRSVS